MKKVICCVRCECHVAVDEVSSYCSDLCKWRDEVEGLLEGPVELDVIKMSLIAQYDWAMEEGRGGNDPVRTAARRIRLAIIKAGSEEEIEAAIKAA